MITIYLDMDGVLCNFNKEFDKYRDPSVKYDKKIFGDAVIKHKIFEDLDYMPNALKLLDAVKQLPVTVEILTSVGTHNPTQGAEAARQKTLWLNKHNIHYKPNFVKMFSEKKQYASSSTILVDDRPDCARPFTEAGGHGILHNDADIDKTLVALDNIVSQLNTIYATN